MRYDQEYDVCGWQALFPTGFSELERGQCAGYWAVPWERLQRAGQGRGAVLRCGAAALRARESAGAALWLRARAFLTGVARRQMWLPPTWKSRCAWFSRAASRPTPWRTRWRSGWSPRRGAARCRVLLAFGLTHASRAPAPAPAKPAVSEPAPATTNSTTTPPPARNDNGRSRDRREN